MLDPDFEGPRFDRRGWATDSTLTHGRAHYYVEVPGCEGDFVSMCGSFGVSGFLEFPWPGTKECKLCLRFMEAGKKPPFNMAPDHPSYDQQYKVEAFAKKYGPV